ncbi:hypothetical protein T03_4216 [Trichinella britovi]|uniref:Uncharacterized protein n=1 Tax=Trichinella britovi TaxID=45882 RepID=A0A0V1CVN2_TRIBR|nr:hypothetical protein T03_4216 [Trichinella britovi]
MRDAVLYKALAQPLQSTCLCHDSCDKLSTFTYESHIATNGYVQCYQALSQVYRVSVRWTLLTYVKATLNSRKLSIEKY